MPINKPWTRNLVPVRECIWVYKYAECLMHVVLIRTVRVSVRCGGDLIYDFICVTRFPCQKSVKRMKKFYWLYFDGDGKRETSIFHTNSLCRACLVKLYLSKPFRNQNWCYRFPLTRTLYLNVFLRRHYNHLNDSRCRYVCIFIQQSH